MTPKAKAGGRGGCVAQPAARSVANASATALSQGRGILSFIGEFLQPVERLEGFLRAQLVGPDLGERGAQIRVGGGCGVVRGAEEIRVARARAQRLSQGCGGAGPRGPPSLGEAPRARRLDTR